MQRVAYTVVLDVRLARKSPGSTPRLNVTLVESVIDGRSEEDGYLVIRKRPLEIKQ